MKFQPKCILSDCDGVIVDSEAVAEGIIIEVLGGIFGCEIVAKEIEGSFGIRIAEILSNLERKHRRVFDACSRISILREIDYRISLASPPIQGVRSAYEALQLPVAIVSNSSPERIRVSVGRAGLDDLVGRHIYSGDEVKNPKPAPDVYLKAARSMGFQPEDCLVIEDSIAGVSAAVAASMKVIGFLGGSHIKPGHEGKLMNAGVFAVIRSFEYLSNLISKE